MQAAENAKAVIYSYLHEAQTALVTIATAMQTATPTLLLQFTLKQMSKNI